MKLRLQSNSIRLRLKRNEVEQLVRTGRVEEEIIMGSGIENSFQYVLESSRGVSSPQVTLKKKGILIQLPSENVFRWATGDDVGIEGTLPVDAGKHLQVLVEKDFACLNGTDEQNADTFPNPLAGTKC